MRRKFGLTCNREPFSLLSLIYRRRKIWIARSTMDNPPTKVNLEDSGCVVDGLRSALLDGNVEDQNLMVRRVQSQISRYFAIDTQLHSCM